MSRYADRLGREEGFDADRRRAAMGAANPAFILRNWVAQASTNLCTVGLFVCVCVP